MTLPDHLLDILCCPVSHEPLRPLGKQRLESLNRRIATGDVLHVDGTTVERPIKAALITRDDRVIYAVEDDIPVLLPDLGIGTTQFTDPL